HEREQITQTGRYKLDRVKARLPKRSALLQLALSGWGDPTGACSEAPVSTQQVADEGLLQLVPEWVFAEYREPGGGVLRPEQWPARYHFRVMVRGRSVQLVQTDRSEDTR